MRRGGAIMQSCEHEHAGGGTAYKPHPPHPTAERGGETQCQIQVRDTIEIGAGSKHRLRAVKALLEKLLRAKGATFYLVVCHTGITFALQKYKNILTYANFFAFLYCNTYRTIPVKDAKYGIMLIYGDKTAHKPKAYTHLPKSTKRYIPCSFAPM